MEGESVVSIISCYPPNIHYGPYLDKYSRTTANRTHGDPDTTENRTWILRDSAKRVKRKKLTKRNEVPSVLQEVLNVLPNSAQGAPEGSNPIPHSLGRGLNSLPYWC